MILVIAVISIRILVTVLIEKSYDNAIIKIYSQKEKTDIPTANRYIRIF